MSAIRRIVVVGLAVAVGAVAFLAMLAAAMFYAGGLYS